LKVAAEQMDFPNCQNQNQEALHLLAGVSDLLSDCMNYEGTLNRIAKLMVSGFANWCTIDLVGENKKIERVAAAHCQPTKTHLVREILAKYPPSPKATQGVYRVIETGSSILISHTSESLWMKRAESSEHLRLIMELGSTSYMCIPLKTQDSVLGAVMLLSEDRTYDEIDLRTAEAIASRLAATIDNAQRFQRLQNSIKLKDEFLSVAMHEIRNPLSLIVWQLEAIDEILSKDHLGEQEIQKVRKAWSSFHRQINRLNPLFKKFLDPSQTDSINLALELKQVNLNELVDEVISRFQVQLETADVQIENWSNPNEPSIGYWDYDRLEQVVSNLISNAIKYGDGRCVVEVIHEADQAKLIVHDQGMGISEKDQARLFEPFRRLKNDPKIHGAGLGMYISKRIVEAHGGEISVHSVCGQGTSFCVRIPVGGPPSGSLAISSAENKCFSREAFNF